MRLPVNYWRVIDQILETMLVTGNFFQKSENKHYTITSFLKKSVEHKKSIVGLKIRFGSALGYCNKSLGCQFWNLKYWIFFLEECFTRQGGNFCETSE